MPALNDNFSLRDKGASNALSLDQLPRHRWYFIKEGFSPTLVDEAIRRSGARKGDILLDPFSGSGTVPLAAVAGGLKARSFEVNPFLRFLSSTKLMHAEAKALRRSAQAVRRAIAQPVPSPLEGYSTFSSGNRWKRWLFNAGVLRGYEAAQQSLGGLSFEHGHLLKLVLLGSALDCCNATRDGKCLRYKKDWKRAKYGKDDLIDAFDERLAMVASDLESCPLNKVNAAVYEGDARKLISTAAVKEKFHLCVTSPPYLNSFDYSDIYRPELFLGGFVSTTKELMGVRLQTVRSHVQASWEPPTTSDFGSLYTSCAAKVNEQAAELWDRRIPAMIQAYFEDMAGILKGLRARALDNASAWFVVSTSAYGGVEIPVDLILAEIGQRNGWFLREVGVLRYLRSSGQHMNSVDDLERKSGPLRESVVIFDASKPGRRRHGRSR